MRAIASAVVLLAGCTLCGLGVIANSIAMSGHVYNDDASVASMGFGAFLILVGAVGVCFGSFAKDK